MALKKYNIHEAKTHLSRLIEKVVQEGESFVIAKAGKPLVKVVALDTHTSKAIKRSGFLKEQFSVPADFNHLGKDKIARLFRGK